MKIGFRENNTCTLALHIFHHGCIVLDDELLCTYVDILAFGKHIVACTTKARCFISQFKSIIPTFCGSHDTHWVCICLWVPLSSVWVQITHRCRKHEHGNCKGDTTAPSHTMSAPMKLQMNTLDFWSNMINKSTISNKRSKATMPNKHIGSPSMSRSAHKTTTYWRKYHLVRKI